MKRTRPDDAGRTGVVGISNRILQPQQEVELDKKPRLAEKPRQVDWEAVPADLYSCIVRHISLRDYGAVLRVSHDFLRIFGKPEIGSQLLPSLDIRRLARKNMESDLFSEQMALRLGLVVTEKGLEEVYELAIQPNTKLIDFNCLLGPKQVAEFFREMQSRLQRYGVSQRIRLDPNLLFKVEEETVQEIERSVANLRHLIIVELNASDQKWLSMVKHMPHLESLSIDVRQQPDLEDAEEQEYGTSVKGVAAVLGELTLPIPRISIRFADDGTANDCSALFPEFERLKVRHISLDNVESAGLPLWKMCKVPILEVQFGNESEQILAIRGLLGNAVAFGELRLTANERMASFPYIRHICESLSRVTGLKSVEVDSRFESSDGHLDLLEAVFKNKEIKHASLPYALEYQLAVDDFLRKNPGHTIVRNNYPETGLHRLRLAAGST